MPTDHRLCPPEAHDRVMYDERGQGQAHAADGLLACNDCLAPAYFCTVDEMYHHVDAPDCFLIHDDYRPVLENPRP